MQFRLVIILREIIDLQNFNLGFGLSFLARLAPTCSNLNHALFDIKHERSLLALFTKFEIMYEKGLWLSSLLFTIQFILWATYIKALDYGASRSANELALL